MSLSTIRQPKKSKKKNHAKTPEARFEREWARVQRLQKRNQKFASEVDALASQVLAAITEQEQAYTQALFNQTERLLVLFGRKSLTLWQKEALLLWLLDNMGTLLHHPFAGHLDVQALGAKMQDAMGAGDPGDQGSPQAYDANEPHEQHEQHELFEDEFAPESEIDDEDAEDTAFFEQLYEDYFNEQDRAHSDESEQSRALDQLLKGSSINKLFRQIARVLHPDREQDESQKKLKHQLMSELIEARDQGDVPKIFALYAEHVGQSPLPMIEGDLDKVTALLKAQARQLEQQKDEILDGNPMHGMIYERFYARTEQGIKANINSHLKAIRRETHQQQVIANHVTSLKKLKPYLEERYDQMQMESVMRELRAEHLEDLDEEGIPF